MATTTERQAIAAAEGETRFLLRNLGWHRYETMLTLLGDSTVRLTYDRGDLELMSPSNLHERFRNVFGRFIETVTVELGLECEAGGSTTWRTEDLDRGLEPHECYYIAHALAVACREVNLAHDPPPDLAIELEISPSQLDRMGIYAALGVPEVWRFDGAVLSFHALQADRHYTPCDRSRSLPFLSPAEVLHWIELSRVMSQTTWARDLGAWVRRDLAPRLQAGAGE
jgi:Uma2 family endonuclease